MSVVDQEIDNCLERLRFLIDMDRETKAAQQRRIRKLEKALNAPLESKGESDEGS